ncbi:prolipoprotein diacylglyceryl transferase [Ostreibacterium oceani]|uniref:Phosphatidylglycerol--prolipoprotein diacylglyceryl transferase n=1 Tax=Ostreibacterium oceani TaxID=2654998 RepID=A0A6N7EV99_9GAMM|nr:prolipoprotein diacylglyceryl transferase [Ostreibacterium oceani]MPV85460.1 prolipoprotein diacylglyceryl transferase [Ostreibacterium oceani]
MIELPTISPYLFTIGNVGPTWYGLMYVVGFLLGYWFAKRQARHMPDWTQDQVSDLLTYAILGVILGGRIGYVLFYQFERFLDNPLYLFKITEGGMSFHGGLLGVMVATFLFTYKHKKSWLSVTDFVAPVFPIGLFFGRIGNFINLELWGKPTSVPWGMVFPTADAQPRHPTQLYEAGLEGLLLFIILVAYSKMKPALGKLSGAFLCGYGVFRFFVEFFREPDTHIGYLAFDWFTQGQLLTLPMIAIGLYLLLKPTRPNLPNTTPSNINPSSANRK